jgi:uncharacterized FAD-dependent dehydrogenase
MIEGLESIPDAQAVISWLDREIAEKKTAIMNIEATGEKSKAVKPMYHLEMLARVRQALKDTVEELDREIDGYMSENGLFEGEDDE